MTTRVSTYDPAKVQVVVGGAIITGFAPGRMIQYRDDGPVISDDEGVDGESVRWRRLNPFGTLTLFLSQASGANFILSSLLNVDRITLAGIVPVMVQDRSAGRTPGILGGGTSGIPTRIIAGNGWIMNQPDMVWGDSPESRQWDIRVLDAVHDIRGYEESAVRIL